MSGMPLFANIAVYRRIRNSLKSAVAKAEYCLPNVQKERGGGIGVLNNVKKLQHWRGNPYPKTSTVWRLALTRIY